MNRALAVRCLWVSAAAALAVSISAFPMTASALPALTTLHSFAGRTDGRNPFGGVVFDSAGILYGTTQSGGHKRFGTIFKIDPTSRTETVLYNFTAGLDGAFPQAGLVLDSTGKLYGTSISVATRGGGAVFRLDPQTKKFTVLHAFTGGNDGFFPQAPLVFDGAGMLYGTTVEGGGKGNLSNCPLFCGTVFRLNAANGQITILHAFTGGTDGGDPFAGLTFGPDGALYGTAFSGGSSTCGVAGCGNVFRIDPASGAFTVLHMFNKGPSDGGFPLGTLTFDATGRIFGTTEGGGAHSAGTIFSLDPLTQTFTLLHTFSLLDRSGGFPNGGVTFDATGTLLYGTNFFGGLNGCAKAGGAGCGTVFRFIPSTNDFTTLHRFTGGVDGGNPSANLTFGKDGDLYSVAEFGGVSNGGTVFKVKP